MSNQLVPRSTQIKTHEQRVADLRGAFKQLAAKLEVVIPNGMKVGRLLRISMTCVQNKPQLLDCDQRSLIAAVVQCAQLGLEPDPVMGQAHLVPFKGKVTLIPGYKGLMDLARRSDKVLSIDAGVAHVNDDYDYMEGSSPFVRVKQTLGPEPGDLVFAWARAEIRSSTHPSVKILPKWRVEQIRAFSKNTAEDAPWKTHYDAQAAKTAIKQLMKVVPASVELRKAVALDDAAEIGADQPSLESVLDGEIEELEGEKA